MEQQDQDDEERQRAEEEKHQAFHMCEEMQTKVRQRMEFHEKNMKPQGRLSEDELMRLGGSIKKNTAFAKKLRELTETKREALIKDFESLNLLKYIPEVATSIAEAKLKLGDVGCAVYICSLVHCRYSEFATELTDQLQRVYKEDLEKEEDKSAMSTKCRLGLRLIGELVLSGIIKQSIGCNILLGLLSHVVSSDLKGKTYTYVTVVTSFARQFADDFAGILPRKFKELCTKYGIAPPQTEIIDKQYKKECFELLTSYFESVKKQLVSSHKEMHKRAKRNRQILQNKGELTAERQEENEKAEKDYDKLLSNVTTLSDILDMDMPDLPEDQTPQEMMPGVSIDIQLPSGGSDEEFGASSLWEDEEQRSFYKDITDIKPFIPAILYETTKRKKTDSSSSDTANATGEGSGNHGSDVEDESKEDVKDIPSEQDEQKVLEEMIEETERVTLEDMEEEEEPQLFDEPVDPGIAVTDASGSGSTPEPNQVDLFLASLPSMMNKKFVDTYATNFCLNMNTKQNRQRLAKALFNVDRNRMDLVPFYARFVATLAPLLSDFSEILVDILIRDFRFQIRKKDQIHIHTKIKNARFIAELTKFGLCPKIETMKCITLTLQDFTHHNVELGCTFIEHCGRYLLRSPDSYLRAKALLEIMMRKKMIQHLDGRQKSLVDDALYAANPPEVKPMVRVQRPPLHEYILTLLYRDLNKLNTEKILKQLRKLPWSDPETFQWAVQALTDAWNVKFSNIHCMANLLAGLRPYQEEATVWVVDGVLEDIRLGLEINEIRMNQRRVAMIKYLGELYNYQLVESNVIFRTLYTLLTFGCNPDGSPGPLDPFESYFRARLVCVLLDTCGSYFDHGSTKKKLEAFLVFFQCYLFSKRRPLPLEVEHMITDSLLGVQPNLTLYSTAAEASEAASNLERKFRSKVGTTVDDGVDDSDDEEEGPLEKGRQEEEEEGEEGEEYVDEENEDDGEDDDEDGNDEDVGEEGFGDEDIAVLKSGPKLISCHEDDEFMAAFDKMMTESRKADPNAKTAQVDIAIPLHLKGATATSKKPDSSLNLAKRSDFEQGPGQIKFTLMTKKGRKQELKDIEIPVDSNIASGLLDTQEQLRAEQKEMKKLVLTHERRQEEEDYQAMMESVSATHLEQSSNVKKQVSQGSRQYQHRPHPSSGYQGSSSGRQHYSHQQSNRQRQRPHPQRRQSNEHWQQ